MSDPTKHDVEWFATRMRAKLALPKNAAKRAPQPGEDPYLFKRLLEEAEELRRWMATDARTGGHAELVIDECADVANFALFIAQLARERARLQEERESCARRTKASGGLPSGGRLALASVGDDRRTL